MQQPIMDRLWVDKHRPKALNKMDYNQDLNIKLKKISEAGDFPHLLFYGPNGAGKKTRIMAFLHEVYGNGVLKLKTETKSFKISSQSSEKIEVNITSSNFHLDITPSDVEMRDRVVMQQLIKEVASTNQLDQRARIKFKVVIINECDRLTKEAQAALRRTMEKYVNKCRLILVCENAGRVIEPLRSRCLMIRVPAPSTNDIECLLLKLAENEKLQINKQFASLIAKNSERNTRRAILQLQIYKMQSNKSMNIETKIHIPEWIIAIQDIAKAITQEQDPKKQRVYELLVNCIPAELIVKYICLSLTEKVDSPALQCQIYHWAAYHENMLQKGNKAIFHIEAFIARLMQLFMAFKLKIELPVK